MKSIRTCALFLLVSLCQQNITGDEHTHKYGDGEEVVLWMNTVGPYHNRQETYTYFSLPFCKGAKKSISHYHETLGEAIQGVELDFINVPPVGYCTLDLTSEFNDALVYAVKNHYWYQMYIDDLPIWGIVGEIGESKDEYYLWTHKKFDISYNGDQIVDVSLTSESKTKLTPDTKISFTYEVKWTESKVEFVQRYDKYLDPSFFQHRERDLGDEYGWKQVHGDVFRAASHRLLFTSLIGTGYHLSSVAACVILFTIMGDLYTSRGSILSTTIFVYAAAAPVNGFMGKQWIKQMLLSAVLFPLLVCGMAFMINFIAIYYHASRAIPFTTMVAVTAIVAFVIMPLTLVGTVLGRNLYGTPNVPCRVNTVPRPIPEKKWFMEPIVIIILGGVLPFGSIFIEMYFIFTSFWAYKIYYVFGFMLLVFLILAIVTVCVTIVCTYFLLNAEDYR
ncbi:Transmembrane 9 superfamily member 3 [Acropora cervicornis]|uniref:Transmembrane 9 superfamily member n=1 Tax=Acropora cervicornis TaxID=6130 RepID=A0AAD9QL59_ACRCE|nr:Transmembrane 9 superfamily member 3 [Acropora cervicornis]